MKKLFKNKPVSAGADQSSARGLVYSDPAPLVLEKRMMFDGAMAGEVLEKTQAAADAGATASDSQAATQGTDTEPSAESAASADSCAASTQVVDAAVVPVTLILPSETPQAVTQAAQQAQQLVSQVLSRSDAQTLLFSLFHGQQGATPDAAWSQALSSLLSGQNGSLGLRVELRSASEMHNAEGAFAAAGPDGKPVIYLNRDWIANGATGSELTRVLVEEIGHALDAQLNAGQDTDGDEGEAFAAVATGNLTSAAIIQADTDYDHGTLMIDGQAVEVEMATLDTANWITIGNPGDPNKAGVDGGWTAAAPDLVANSDHPYLEYKLTTVGADTYLNVKLRVEKAPPKDLVLDYGQTLLDLNGDGIPEFALFLHVTQENGYNRSTQVDPVTGYVTNAASNYTYQIYFVPLTSSGPDSNTRPNNTTFASQKLYMVYDSNRNKSASGGDATQVAGNTYDAKLSVFFALGSEADLDNDGVTENYYVMSFKASAYSDFASYVSNSLSGMQQLSTTSWPTGGSSANPVLYGASVSATQANSVNGDIGGGAFNGSETWRSIFGINQAPVAKGNTYTTLEDTALSGRNIITNADPVNGSDSDAETAASLLRIASINGVNFVANGTDASHLAANGWMQVSLSHGTVFIKADGSMDYKPAQDDTAGDSFTYTIKDAGDKVSNSATVSFSVTPVNDAPTTVNDANTAKEAGGVNNGTAGVNPEGNVITGVVSLTAGTDSNKAADNDVESGTAALKVIAIANLAANTSASVTTAANNINSAYASTNGQYGTLRMLSDGSYRYVVDNSKAAVQALRLSSNTLTETFTYTITDPDGATATATLLITITGANDAPVAANDTNTAKESLQSSGAYGASDPQGSLATGNVLTNDTDVDGNGETKSIVGTLASATLTGSTVVGGSTSLVFVPGTTFSPVGSGDEAWLEVTVNGTTTYRALFDASGNQVTATGGYNSTTRTIPLSANPASYYDASVQGNRITLSSFDNVVIGFKNSSNTTTETSSGMKKGTVSSTSSTGTTTYNLGSLSGNVAAGMSVTGTGVPANTVVTSVTYDSNGNATGVVLNNAITTGTGGSLSFAGAAAVTLTGRHGTLVLNADGSYVYTPTANNPNLNEGESAQEIFQYQMQDALGATSTATLTITVYGSGTNDPNAVNDTASAVEAGGSNNGASGINPSGNVLTNDTTPVGSNLVIAGRAPGGAADSTLFATATGNLTNGGNTITLSGISDTLAVGMLVKSGSGIANGTTILSISGNVVTLSANMSASVTAASLLFVRPASTDLVLTGQYGQLTLHSDGSYTYAVDNSNATVQAMRLASESLTEVFNYRVSNGNFASGKLLSDAATLTITISGANDAPVGVADTATATEAGVNAGSAATGNVLSNDTDVDAGDSKRVTAVLNQSVSTPVSTTVTTSHTSLSGAYASSVGLYGTLRILSDGSFQYDVDNSNATVNALSASQTLTEQFVYTVSDSIRSATATATSGATALTISASSGISVGDSVSGTGIAAGTLVSAVTRNASGVVTGVTLNTATTASLSGASLSFSSSGTATLTITILGANDAPVARGNSYTATEDTLLSGKNIISNDTGAGADYDPESSPLTVASINGLSFASLAASTDAGHPSADGWKALSLDKGTLYVMSNGAVDYMPFANANGSDSFSYTISDGSAVSNEATVSFSITPVNDAPTLVANPIEGQVQESSLATGTKAGEPYANYDGHFIIGDVDGLSDIASISFKNTGSSDKTLTVGNGAGQFATLADMVGQSFNTANGTVTLLSYADGDFTYRFTLTSKTTDVDNATETNSFTVEVKDSGNATASATVSFEIVDDAPALDAGKLGTLGPLTADDSTLSINPTASAADVFANAINYGADGAGSASYSLVLNGVNVGSGLYAVDSSQTGGKGSEIMLSQSGNVISGKVGSTTYFTITIVNASGLITFDQQLAVWHGDASDPDDVATLSLASASSLQLSATFVDGDGDSLSHTLDIGQSASFKIKDDGPTLTGGSVLPADVLTADEAQLNTQVTANFADNFSAAVSYGADGAGATRYSLVVNGTPGSGLYAIDTSALSNKGAQILLVQDGNAVYGKVGTTTLFTIQIDATTGVVTFTQSAPIWHPDSSDANDIAALTLANASDFQLRASFADADGDSVSQSINLSGAFKIKDSGPAINAANVASADVLTVDENSLGTVVTADFLDNFTGAVTYGDGLASKSFQFELNGTPATGLYAVDTSQANGKGSEILLSLAGGVVSGKVGSTTYFTIDVDAATGVVSFKQLAAVWHADSSDAADTSILTLANAGDLKLTARFVDVDGDSASHSINLGQSGSFKFKDSGPVLTAGNVAAADVLTAQEGSLGTTVTASFADNFASAINYGADGQGSASYSLVLNGTPGSGLYAIDTTQANGKGSEILLSQVGNEISGKVGNKTYFSISIDNGTGVVSFTQQAAIWHADSADAHDFSTLNLANATDLKLLAVFKDGDGDSVSHSINLGQSGSFKVKDDGPSITGGNVLAADVLTIDETSLNSSATASFADNFAGAVQYGADGAGSASYALTLNGTPGSGLFAVDASATNGKGAEIVLSQDGNLISGKVGSTVYFTISLDSATGVVSFTQMKSVWHADNADADDVATLRLANADDLKLSIAVSDADGDQAGYSLNLGQSGSFRIKDDGPSISLNQPSANAGITASEDSLSSAGSSQGTADFSIHFNSPVYGADGAGSAGYALRLSGAPVLTNLYLQDNADTSGTDGDGIGQGERVQLSMDGNDVVGKVGSTVVLRIAVNAASGEVTLTQYQALWHDTSGSYQQTLTLTLSPGALALERSVSDADGDQAKVNYDLGANGAFKFQSTPVPSVDSIRVNEGSPWAVFTVTGASGQWVKLALSEGSAKQDVDASHSTDGSDDFGPGLQYWNGTQWTDYTAGSQVQIPAGDTHLFVRTAIVQDTVSEGEESFTLTVTNSGGQSNSGTATIDDQGGGRKYPDANPPVGGPPVTAAAGPDASYDDDRALTVNSVRVNEASPWVVFSVKGNEGQFVKLALADGSATMDTDSSRNTDGSDDYGPGLQYWNGSQWTAYTPGSYVQIPAGGDILRVRTAIINDNVYEGDQSFTLTAWNTGGAGGTGTATIDDHGGGVKFLDADPGNSPPTDSSNLDDDRPLTVSSRTFNEASPYAVFEVSGVAGQLVSLALGNTAGSADQDATLGTDTANAGNGVPLQYFNGTAWVDYTPGSKIAIPGPGNKLLVRTAIVNDTLYEGAETFTLIASNASGKAFEGVATIIDDGSGVVYDADGNPTTNTPDDDRPKPPKAPDPAPVTIAPTQAPVTVAMPEVAPQPFLPTTILRVESTRSMELPSLTLANGIPDQFSEQGAEARFAIPEGTFLSSNAGDRLNLAASMADGRPLPNWLNFDGTTGVFTGKPPPGFEGELQIRVMARDQTGNKVETLFRFHVGDKNKPRQIGKPASQRSAAAEAAAQAQGWDLANAGNLPDKADAQRDAKTDDSAPGTAKGRDQGLPGRPGLAQQLREQSLRTRLAKSQLERIKRAG